MWYNENPWLYYDKVKENSKNIDENVKIQEKYFFFNDL